MIRTKPCRDRVATYVCHLTSPSSDGVTNVFKEESSGVREAILSVRIMRAVVPYRSPQGYCG